MAEFLFSRRVCAEVFEPIFAELTDEYQLALAEGSVWRARMTRVRACWSFWSALLAELPVLKVVCKLLLHGK